ncbi:MAG: response regulator [Nitrososphaerota archaeon]|jgi:DNA-binding NtrC family response regulator|uniref:response regulator n=1 Tax=Candidatus Bathycorpusculum sp. TaxID=2994959 RepID=UPI00282501EC|nr:response regulator [Candidatus Termitimicrobium sp.]MCL2432104.1 response regulator [Candidatus Termitimicrobium sp.]MDR0492652.1 response regulator [Nitrososphaerota archaeon]
MSPITISEEKTQAALIVDDDKAILRTFSIILKRKGYTTDTAETGKEALDKISYKNYDVALIDMRLPDIQGTDLVAKLPEKSIKMVKIILTGLLPIDPNSQTDPPVDAYLLKPIKPEDLLSIIETNLQRRNLKNPIPAT